ncbi:hypothetical protein PF005_g12886 [Phytophthora fragariae]|nr:hypothetical protein PF009_g14083 [Phytophthora fragariae]KAE9006178.1 hypothetical protein PF011_g11699 [Phytophthora fragariae]KAE9107496.1 hypothetical protein PF010_g12243 [Phytophthora fragariae]KAE9206757.1 hypothetical protein PF005_g12886 [Phytophthora fragariae]KAE9225667.1 hypothetical protein PF004_g11866 [Phytophthora fragariae]
MSMLSQYLDKAQDFHWHAAIRVLRYLKGTSKMALVFKRGSSKNVAVSAFCDANWGGDLATRRSTSGVLVLMDGAPVIFKSKRQSSVALSTAETEYMALALTTQELEWLRQLLDEIGMQVARPMLIKVDNQAAISIAHNCGYSPRAKHIDLRLHFIRDHVEAGHIAVEYIASVAQLADYLTKPLATPQFAKLVMASGVKQPHQVEGEC